MNNAELSNVLTSALDKVAHTDLVKEYRRKFYKLSQEAERDGVSIEYMVHDREVK